MAVALSAVVNIVSGVASVVVAAALVLLRPPRPGIVAFGLFALVSGLQQILGNLGSFSPAFTTYSWPFIAVSPLAIVWAVSTYTGRRVWLCTIPFAVVAIIGTAILYIDADLMLLPDGSLGDAGIILWSIPTRFAMALSVIFLVLRHRRASSELRTEMVIILCALLPPLAYSSSFLLYVLVSQPVYGPMVEGAYIFNVGVTLAISVWCSVVLSRSGHRPAVLVAILAIFATMIGLVQAALITEPYPIAGAFRLTGAILLGYGLLKYGIFGTDLKLKWTLDRGALLAIFGGVFFLVDQAAQFFVSAAFGAIAGIAAAVGLLFLLKPLRKATQRLADRIFPHVDATPEYFAQRKLVVYRSAAHAAAKDGVITDREREMLAALVRELAITSDEVATVEREVLSRASAA